jgi:hypothetical protein
MATCRDIITRALQVSGIVALGRDPRAAESVFGLEVLQGLYDQWATSGMFGRLTDTYQTTDYTAKEWERVIAPSAITVTKPTTISAENGRAPYELASIVTILNGAQTTWVYTRGAWVSLTGLELTDDAPFADYNRQGLSALLGTRIAETFGRELKASIVKQGREFQGMVSAKFGTTQPMRKQFEPDDY